MAESDTALTVRVHKLQKQLESIQAAVNKHETVAAELAKVTKTVQDHIAGEEERAAAVTPPVWFGLSRDQYDAQLQRLRKFVDGHLRVTYRDYLGEVLHDCWARHPAALWELGNLQAEWDRIYQGDRPSLASALAWHDRWLPGVRARLVDIMHGCREDRCRHQRPTVSGWGTR